MNWLCKEPPIKVVDVVSPTCPKANIKMFKPGLKFHEFKDAYNEAIGGNFRYDRHFYYERYGQYCNYQRSIGNEV